MDIQWSELYPTESDFSFWIQNDLNVILVGGHGIGKTAMVRDAFEAAGLNYRYFSAPTMDPWVDFIGVPREQHDEEGAYLDLVRPKDFRDDKVEALFFDEYNRAPSKVQNAVMELIQFRSVNGRKFPNLRFVWAAINDNKSNEYNVEQLDYAQIDRFHVIVRVPNSPLKSYFTNKFGILGEVGCSWWHKLPEQVKNFVSPRRLEYTLEMFQKGGDLTQLLPDTAGVGILISNLMNGLSADRLRQLVNTGDEDELKSWLDNEQNYSAVKDTIENEYLEQCFHLLSTERQVSMLSRLQGAFRYVSENIDLFGELTTLLKNLPVETKPHWVSSLFDVHNRKTAILDHKLRSIEFYSDYKKVAVRAREINSQLYGKTWDDILNKDPYPAYTMYEEGRFDPNSYKILIESNEPYSASIRTDKVREMLYITSLNSMTLEVMIYKLNYYMARMQRETLKSMFSNYLFVQHFRGMIDSYLSQIDHPDPKTFFNKFEGLYLPCKVAGVIVETP